MVLHIQAKVSRWNSVHLGNVLVRKGQKPCLFQRIMEELCKEKNTPSKKRKCAGFHITLSEEEENKLIKMINALYGPLSGKIEDDHRLVDIVNLMAKSYNNSLRVSVFTDRYKEGDWTPLFCFHAEEWLR